MTEKTKRFSRTLLMLIIGISTSIVISSCSHSFSGCYDITKYQKKQRNVDKSGIFNYNPKKYKHAEPLRKKWVIGGSRPTVLGHDKR